MKLGAKTLFKLTKGAVYYEARGGYYTPLKYSREQIEYMADPAYDWGWRMRARFTGGIRLEFKTDSQKIAFDYRASHSHERANTVDLYVDGVLTSVYYIEEKLKGHIEFALPKGEKRVTIYLPGESEFAIKSFTLEGGYKSVKDKGMRLLILGDSITQGAGPDIASASYAHGLQRRTGYNILAQGIGGYRFEAKDLSKTQGFEPDKIMVFLGTNYYEESCLERCNYDYEKATYEYFDTLTRLYPKTPILCLTPLWRTRDLDMSRFMWCINTIKSACQKHESITVLDGFTVMPNVVACLSDGVHPSTYGSELLSQNLAKYMKENRF